MFGNKVGNLAEHFNRLVPPDSFRLGILAIVLLYAVWCIFWIVVSGSGGGESLISGTLLIAIPGLPATIVPVFLVGNPGVQHLFLVAAVGMAQWLTILYLAHRRASGDEQRAALVVAK